MDYTNDQIEKILNDTFPGLTLFYRDTNLSNDLILKYKPGQIIQEKAFVDISYRGGGLTTNFRYLIASSNAKNIEEQVVEKARLNFKEKLTLPVIPELNTSEWHERVEFPLGTDDEGSFF